MASQTVFSSVDLPTLTGDSGKDTVAVRKSLNDLLANDNTLGTGIASLSSSIASLSSPLTIYRASYYTASFTFTTANVTTLALGTRQYDANNLFNSTHANAFTCPAAGFLKIGFWGALLTPYTNITIYKNGSLVPGSGSGLFMSVPSAAQRMAGVAMVQCASGDYFDIRADTNGTAVSVAVLWFELMTQ